MSALRQMVLAVLMVFLWISASAGEEKGGQAVAPEPIVVYKAAFPISLGGAEYDLLSIIQDFPPGSGVAAHTHGGHVLVTVLNGEMTLREKGSERALKAGESWTEQPGSVHAVVNAAATTTRVAISMLLPKGAPVTTLAK